MDIQPIISQVPGDPRATPAGEAGRDEKTFTQTLKESIQEVDGLQAQADEAIAGFMAGKNNLHETVIALQKADMSFQVMMQIRNKIISAYEEIIRMQV